MKVLRDSIGITQFPSHCTSGALFFILDDITANNFVKIIKWFVGIDFIEFTIILRILYVLSK